MHPNPEQRKLAAIMFTDMVGYSALTQRDEALALDLLEEHHQILRDILPMFQGNEIKSTGDGLLVEFSSALAAVQCAVEIQRTLAERNEKKSEERQIKIRIGIHLGDVVMRGDDVLGDGVNIAARIEPLAEPGGICVTRAVFEQIENKVAQPCVQLSKPELKNISANVEVYKLVLGVTPADLQTAARKSLHTTLVVVAFIALNAFLFWKFGLSKRPPVGGEVALPAAGMTSTNADQKSIAVLAFANLSDDKANEFFSDGISEELLNVLAKIPGLKVTARTSAFHFKGKDTPIPEIAKQLGVAYVVEGSVRKAGDKVRITAQLIKAADGFHVWSDTFTRDLKDIFAVQDEIAGLIAQNLQLKLGESSRVARVVNPEAHRLVLEGRHFWSLRTPAGFERALTALTKAVELDPEFPQARAALADVLVTKAIYATYSGKKDSQEAHLARAEAQRALALDPTLVEARPALGAVFMFEGKLAESEAEYRKAFALNPNYALAHHWCSLTLELQGRLDAALEEIDRAVQLDPLASTALLTRARMLRETGRFEESLETCDQAIRLRPDFPAAAAERAATLLRLDRRAEAVQATDPILANVTNAISNLIEPARTAQTIAVLRQAGQESLAIEYAERLLKQLPADNYVRGAVLAAMGRWQEALPALEHTPTTQRYLFFWGQMWDEHRDSPQFKQLLAKLDCVKEYEVARETQARMLKERPAAK